MENKTVYSIVRNKTNEVIFITDNYNFIKQYVIKHFPNYTINEKYKTIIIHSNHFTFNKTEMNYDINENEYYK